MEKRFDVLAVNQQTKVVSLMGENKTERAAEGIEMMAIGRRGMDVDFYVIVPHGQYKEGDVYAGSEE